jgi:hypothetical protein
MFLVSHIPWAGDPCAAQLLRPGFVTSGRSLVSVEGLDITPLLSTQRCGILSGNDSCNDAFATIAAMMRRTYKRAIR